MNGDLRNVLLQQVFQAIIPIRMLKKTPVSTVFFVLLLLATVGCAGKKLSPSPALFEVSENAARLFDGASFDGWEKGNEFFRVEDESIVGGSLENPIPQNEFLCTERQYSNFRLKLETRLLGDQTNAGIQFHSERIPDDNEVIGYQADIGAGYWGGLYDESRRNRLMAAADDQLIEEILNVGDWNVYELEADGPDIRIAINGRQTISYREGDPDIPLEGHICLQIHSGPPGEVWYKSILIDETR